MGTLGDRGSAWKQILGLNVLIGMLIVPAMARTNLAVATYTNGFWKEKYTAIREPGYIPIRGIVRSSPVEGIVKTQGTRFTVNGKPFYFAGTNAYYLAMPDLTEYEEIETFFQVSNDQGVTVVRIWGFSNGDGKDSIPLEEPIQPKIGVWNEIALKQLDKVIATAGQNGIRLIIPFVNYWKEFGGMQWYVDEVLGAGKPLEAFYTDTKVKTAFKNYITMIINRVNSFTKIPYKQDPAVFAWELANEPHTSDGFDNTGGVVKAWVAEIAAHIKSLDPLHLVATGEEGYGTGRTNGNADWLDNGLKGVDFRGNTADKNIDFATVHLYPTAWGFEENDFWLGTHFVVDRAQIAHSLNKPVILEEIGIETPTTTVSRDHFFRVYFGYANSVDYGAALVWQIYAWPINTANTFNFDWLSQGSYALRRQIEDMADRTHGTYVPSPIPSEYAPDPPSPPAPPSPPPDACSDVPPPGAGNYPCSDQASWGKCKQPWMVGYCRKSCKTCNLPPGPGTPPSEGGGGGGGSGGAPPPPNAGSGGNCTDKAPPGNYTCQQQFAWGKCNEKWMKGYCDLTCSRCKGPKPCTDVPPPGNFSCAQQVAWDKCNVTWMRGYCDQSCGKCEGVPPPCTDVSPSSDYTCPQQAAYGKCSERWMKGFCLKSCGNCSGLVPDPGVGGTGPPGPPPAPGGTPGTGGNGTCTDLEPPGGYSCQIQGIIWGKCKEAWMKGYCDQTCGRCAGVPPPCTDLLPAGQTYSCGQQAIWGKCTEKWMKGYCDHTCGRCPGVPPPCTDIAPSEEYTCQEQAVKFQKCKEPWMKGFCAKSCGTCNATGEPPSIEGPPPAPLPEGPPSPPVSVPSPPPEVHGQPPPSPVPTSTPAPTPLPTPVPTPPDCPDVPPPGNSYTCSQQQGWGKCPESWMAGYCLKSCGKCTGGGGGTPGPSVTPTPSPSPVPVPSPSPLPQPGSPPPAVCHDVPPPGSSFSCTQQQGWGKCNEAWMKGYCLMSCGKCNEVPTTSCEDVPPAGSSYSCAQQLSWGKCKEGWMAGYCKKSCGTC